MSDKVCLVTGVGPGTGSHIVKKFAAEGYQVAMLARTAERLWEYQEGIPNTRSYQCDVGDYEQLQSTIDKVTNDLGAPEVVVHNAYSGSFGDILNIKPEVLAQNFQINTMSLLYLTQLVAPAMIERGSGTILCTGNTSAYRGKASFAGFAPTKAAQRILAESAARRLGPEGIHVAYIAIDAVIDVPWARQMFADKPDDFFCKPEDIASECFRVAQQPRSAWSFNVEIRPFGENW